MSLFNKLLEISRRSFIRNVAVVASGTAVAQAITMAFTPFITRFYGPEAFGIVGVFMSLSGVSAAVASLAYPVAIVLPKYEAEAMGLVGLSISIGVVASALTAITLFFFGNELLTLLNAGEIVPFAYLIPMFMLISVLVSVASQWMVRKKAFKLVAKVKVTQALVVGAAKVSIGFVWPTPAVLLVTNVSGVFLGCILMVLGIRNIESLPYRRADGPMTKPTYWSLAKKYYDFPLYRAPQELLNSVSYNLPIMMLAAYFGAASVGYYSIASAVLGMPIVLIGGAVMQVFYPHITAAIQNRKNVKMMIIKATAGLALSGAPLFILVLAFGPDLFEFLFGPKWYLAGTYAQWLSMWLFFQYINRPAVAAIPALGLQRGLLIYEILSTGTKVLALYIGYVVYGSDVAAIALFSIFGTIAYLGLILWVTHTSGKVMDTNLIRL